MNISKSIIAFLLFGLLATQSAFSAEKLTKREKLTQRIVNSEYVLEEVMSDPNKAIPTAILQKAKAIILTVNYRGGLFIAGHGGSGVIIAKNKAGEWGVPAFVKLGGISLGLQAGVKERDNVFLIMDDETLRKAYSGRFKIGADATAIAGPRGVISETQENLDFKKANILVYSSSKGLYLGVAVKGGWIKPDHRSSKYYYSTKYKTPEIIMSDWFDLPEEAKPLLGRLNGYTYAE